MCSGEKQSCLCKGHRRSLVTKVRLAPGAGSIDPGVPRFWEPSCNHITLQWRQKIFPTTFALDNIQKAQGPDTEQRKFHLINSMSMPGNGRKSRKRTHVNFPSAVDRPLEQHRRAHRSRAHNNMHALNSEHANTWIRSEPVLEPQN